MKNKKLISLILIFSIFSSTVFQLFADTNTPKPYDDKEMPQGLKDLRRFEIITFGSMPFIMLDSTIAYSSYKSITGKSESFDFFTSNTYTYDETKNLILTSLGISVGIALTDYIVRLIKRGKNKNRVTYNNIEFNIIPYDSEFDFTDFDNYQTQINDSADDESFMNVENQDETKKEKHSEEITSDLPDKNSDKDIE